MPHRMMYQHKYCIGDNCPICPKYDDPRFASGLSHWIIPKSLLACIHLGKDTGNKVLCPSCEGNVQLKIFECEVYGECTIGKRVPEIACCNGCKDYIAS